MQVVDLQHFSKMGTPPSMLIEKALPEKSLMVLVGEPYVGKSLIALELGMSVALGRPALGKFSSRRANVLYVAADAPTWYGAWQVSSLLRGADMEEAPEGQMWFAPPGQGLRPLDTDEDAKRFIDEIHALDVELVVLDTLRKMHTQDENLSGPMTAVVDRCRMMNAAGMGVILVHHASKNNDPEGASAAYRGRGSTVVPGEVDINWLIEKRPHASHVTVAKGRGASLEGPFDVTINSSGTPERPALRVRWAVPLPEPERKPQPRRSRNHKGQAVLLLGPETLGLDPE